MTKPEGPPIPALAVQVATELGDGGYPAVGFTVTPALGTLAVLESSAEDPGDDSDSDSLESFSLLLGFDVLVASRSEDPADDCIGGVRGC